MFVIAVGNAKGGCGKTTVATQLAARYALAGLHTTLIDLDKQRAAFDWVHRRPSRLPTIHTAHADIDELELPRDSAIVVLDVPAGPRRKALEALIKVSDLLVVPVQPSAFDQTGTKHFLELVAEHKPVRKGRRPVAVVANRIRPKATGYARFETFLAGLGFPVITRIADSPFYVTAAETGLTVFDQPKWRVKPRLAEWAPLERFIQDNIPAQD